MRRRGAVLAARGQGFGLYAHDTPVGRFDPAFFVVDNAFARARRLWEFSLADFLPHKVSAPGFVALWALGRVGVHRFWRYAADDGGEGPIAFDPARGFLRVDASRLPPDLASRLVASYFAEYGVTRGPAIEAFHARWGGRGARGGPWGRPTPRRLGPGTGVPQGAAGPSLDLSLPVWRHGMAPRAGRRVSSGVRRRRAPPRRAPGRLVRHAVSSEVPRAVKDLAIAISVYDKFQDVKLLSDLFRKNWPGSYDLVVCSSHPQAASRLADCDIDELLSTENLPMDGPGSSDPRVSPRARLWVRVIDSIRKACGRCADRAEAPFTLHLHADACPLSWPKLRRLAERMQRHGKWFAARGEGFGFYAVNEPGGGL